MYNYAFKPYDTRRKGKYLVGIEIEANVRNCYTFEVPNKIKGTQFITKEDGSISGIEFVSQPLPEKVLKEKIARLFREYDLYGDSSCGIHVHVSRTINPDLEWVFNRYLTLHRSTIYTLIAGRRMNDYTDALIEFTPYDLQHYHYSCINFQHKDTYEVRIFASGNNLRWATSTIDRAIALLQFKETHSFNEEFPKYFEHRFGYSLDSVKLFV